MELVAGFIACMLTVVVCVEAILPYYGYLPRDGNNSLVAAHDALIGNMFIAVVSFFFGASVGSRQKENASHAAALDSIGMRQPASAQADDPPNPGL